MNRSINQTPDIKISKRMRMVGRQNTLPELLLRKELHRLGLRYRLHVKSLPGSPDLVFSRWKTVIFVHGCFWHRHPDCKFATMPKRNIEFWEEKFRRNINRDASKELELQAAGWLVLVAWECNIKLDAVSEAGRLAAIIRSRNTIANK